LILNENLSFAKGSIDWIITFQLEAPDNVKSSLGCRSKVEAEFRTYLQDGNKGKTGLLFLPSSVSDSPGRISKQSYE
jgi:hypothetical protein